MSDSCSEVANVGVEPTVCPEGGARGTSVAWQTVAALVRGHLPLKQEFRLCREPSCPVVYFGSEGTELRVEDLCVSPGFKEGGDGLLCYCFEVRKTDLVSEIAETGSSGALNEISAEVEAGNCACEVRNPSGKCCLGEIGRAIRSLEKELGVTN